MGMLDGKTALVTGSGAGHRTRHRDRAGGGRRQGGRQRSRRQLEGGGGEKGPADQVVDEIRKTGGTAEANYGSVADFAQAHRDGRAGRQGVGPHRHRRATSPASCATG